MGDSTDKSVELIHTYETWLAEWASGKARGRVSPSTRGLPV